MTLGEMVQEVFETLGEPSDLEYRDPVTLDPDITSLGWKRIVQALNAAQNAISTWKFPEGRQLRFRSLEDVATFKTSSSVVTTLMSSGDPSILILPIPSGGPGYTSYVGLRAQFQLSDGTTFTTRITSASPSPHGYYAMMWPAPQNVVGAGTSVTLSTREYRFVNVNGLLPPFEAGIIPYDYLNGEPLEILNVEDISNQQSLEYNSRHEHLIDVELIQGIPGAYYKLATGVRFNIWPNDNITYAVRHMRTPKPFVDDVNAVSELPVNFHPCIVLHASWWGYRRMQENNSAYSVKRDLDDMLRRLRTEFDLEGEFGRSQWSIKVVPY